MIKSPEITHTQQEFKIPESDEINLMTKQALHWALFCVDHKLKIFKSHYQPASTNDNVQQKSVLKTEIEKLEELKAKISDKLNPASREKRG